MLEISLPWLVALNSPEPPPIKRLYFCLIFYVFLDKKLSDLRKTDIIIVTDHFVSQKLTPFNHTVLTARNDATGKFSRPLILSKRN